MILGSVWQNYGTASQRYGNERLAGASIDLGAYESGSRVLPIQLAAFNVVRNGNDALLQWSTAAEDNNCSFYIEYSVDGTNWSNLVFVATQTSRGNSQSPLEYRHTHINPGSGQHFYRLQQVDLDGRYSEVMLITFDSRAEIALYPDPAKSVVTIKGLGNGVYKVSLLNAAGQVIHRYKVRSQAQSRIDMSGLSIGVYYTNYTFQTDQNVSTEI